MREQDPVRKGDKRASPEAASFAAQARGSRPIVQIAIALASAGPRAITGDRRGFFAVAPDSPASAKATACVAGSGVAMNGGDGQPAFNPAVAGWAALTLPSSPVGGAMEALPPCALPDRVSATHETTIPELSTWAIAALGFVGRGYSGFRSNRRKPIRIDEAKA